MTSGFGYRVQPTAGASTNHRGVDWATPTGTAVVASSGGVVTRAGWSGGYGYVVFIDHPDGRQTRYGHLSRVLVRVGQVVSQREKIALSGNTGVSTGPHIHFEILINGQPVNPLRYLN
jgi:murein DD-endopeptidase MepM/ murein hydrolase activator NlpD